jgi:hypothetical protein
MADQHSYRSCRDKDCEQPYCAIWKEAWAEGYDEGFIDGVAACPRPHARG